MKELKEAFGFLQKIGKSLMLPVSVLPVAGILLGVGQSTQNAEHDFFKLHGVHRLPAALDVLTQIMAKSGDAVFHNLALIFAIGVALGLTGNDGVSALAAVVGYVVLTGTLGVMADVEGLKANPAMGVDNPLDTGVLGGIIIGLIAAYMFNRYYRIVLPPYLGFFAGKRFVPIITAFAAIAAGLVLSVVWPPIQNGITAFANFAAYGNPALAVTIYGVVERTLLPFGLHHIWNVPFFFQIGSYTVPGTSEIVHGDITRFMHGDPTAGILGGGFLFKMWGLPAAAIAIWHSARPERRVEVGGIMVSAALTSFLTGITEPIEFSFMFVAPLLYAMHAVLAGTAFFLMQMLGTHMGFTFSQGCIDYLLYASIDTKPWVVLIIGPMYGVIYYGVFRFAIHKFDLKTPGREAIDTFTATVTLDAGDSKAAQILAALGGVSNLTNLDACITRLRVGLVSIEKANPDRLRALGAAGVMVVGNGLQAIFGTASENLKTEIELLIKSGGDVVSSPPSTVNATPAAVPIVVPVAVTSRATAQAEKIMTSMGGAANVRKVQPVALTRVRMVVSDPGQVNVAQLESLGISVMTLKEGTFHLIVGTERCAEDAAALQSLLKN